MVGVGALAGAGAIGYAWPRSSAGGKPTTSVPSPSAGTSTQQANGVHSFVSRPDLQPPVLAVDVASSPSGLPGYVFLANKPYASGTQVGQVGPLVAARDGDITWFSPVASGQVLDFNVQSYKGENVLTWWHGETGASYGQGTCYIADSSYTQIATVQCGNGLKADMHEFNITAQGTR